MKKLLITMLFLALMPLSAASARLDSEPAIRKALASGKPTLVDFGASFCIPCQRMKPVLEALEKEYRGKVNVFVVDVKDENTIGSRFRVGMIPTQIFYDARGNEVKRHFGFMDKPEIVKVFQEIGVK